MTYTLYLGDRSYSSWSLRIWLLREVYDLPLATKYVDFSQSTVADQLAEIAPARTVPTLKTPENSIISESIAIAEELATRFPEAPLWPSDPALRATARGLTAEMHSGFSSLREACPMNLRVAYKDVPVSDAVAADMARLEVIWKDAFARSGGPWLCGDYSIADAFYAPVVMRIAGYGLRVSDVAAHYVDAHLTHRPFRRWRAMGLVSGETLPWYRRDYPTRPWPGPTPLEARATDDGSDSVNQTCPYSGDPVTDFLVLDGRTYGFCNPFCRNKTVADPGAWDRFMALTR